MTRAGDRRRWGRHQSFIGAGVNHKPPASPHRKVLEVGVEPTSTHRGEHLPHLHPVLVGAQTRQLADGYAAVWVSKGGEGKMRPEGVKIHHPHPTTPVCRARDDGAFPACIRSWCIKKPATT